jgi:predicted Zn-dependent protease with MMP-like domain
MASAIHAMNLSTLETIARRIIEEALDDLPDEVAVHARRVVVVIREASSREDHPEVGPGELLGLFSGLAYAEGEPRTPEEMPRITLFLKTIWEEAGGDLEVYEEELETTFLHELGHYLGWDEADLEERGLG